MATEGDRAPGLRRLLAPIGNETRSVTPAAPLAESPRWLHRDGWRVFARPAEHPLAGDPLATFELDDNRSVDAVIDSDGDVVTPFDLDEAYGYYVSEGWRVASQTTALSPRTLSAFYSVKRLIPRRLQLAARRALIRRQGVPAFPAWPLDDSVGRLLRFYARCLLGGEAGQKLLFRWFWPNGAKATMTLTHDVESAEGLRGAVAIADLEEERGLRSSFNVVADWYPIDVGILDELTARGFEIGVHGLHHDRSLFASRDSFEGQLPQLEAAARRFHASGFRSPATHRVYDWLAELPVEYDCTIPNSDPYEPQPGGCCSVWPFFNGSVVELPYTMPQDHTLFTLLRESTACRWIEQLDQISERHGLVQVVSHPDPGYLAEPANRARYVELLEAAKARSGIWHALPRDVASWWRGRDAEGSSDPRITAGQARITDDGSDVSFSPRLEDRTDAGT